MRRLLALIAIFAMANGYDRAQAATLDLTARFGGYQSLNAQYYGHDETILAGTFAGTLTGGPAGYATHFDTYCVDLSHYINGSWDVQLKSTDLLAPPNGKGVAWLYDRYASSVTDLEHGAALQVAIWKVLTDDDKNLDTGNFQLKTGGQFRTDVQTYLNAWNGSGSDEATWFQSTSHPGGVYNQDQVGPNAVPEPGVVSMIGAGMCGLSVMCLRRRRK